MMMNEKQKTILLTAILLLTVCSPMIIAQFSKIWERQMEPETFTFTYVPPPEFNGFLSTTWLAYSEQTEELVLLNGETMLTIVENTYDGPLSLTVSFTSTAAGANVICTGKYISLTWADQSQVINNAGPVFDVPTDGTPILLDSSALQWSHPFTSVGTALQLTFSIDKSGITETVSGTFEYAVTLGIHTET